MDLHDFRFYARSMGAWEFGGLGVCMWEYGSIGIKEYGSTEHGTGKYESMGFKEYRSMGVWEYGSMGDRG